MKKFAMLLIVVCASMFAMGCDNAAPKKTEDKPAAGADKGAEKPAESKPAETPAK
jgi:hypothetical protein